MAKKKKQYKDYQDYLASPEWKALKKSFYKNYEGFKNVCQITGYELDEDEDGYMCLHHWRYPKNWNNDSIDNLILVNNTTHDFIHNHSLKHCSIDNSKLYNTRQKYICEAIRGWIYFTEEIESMYNLKVKRSMRNKISVLENKLSIAKENAVNTCVALKED